MRKSLRRITAAAAAFAAAAALTAGSAFADGRKVVTLGSDLDQSQVNSIVSYFGADLNKDDVVWVNNSQERELLGSWVPIEQIGTRTLSCAYVRPTTSGGIQVKTANLTWVTANMIAASLATSGASNCEVIAACPFPVSGTGALTGVLLAYENATGTKLDESKKQLAAQEMVTTAEIADEIGRNEASALVNDVKIQIVNGMIQEQNSPNEKPDVQKIVDDAVKKALEKRDAEHAAENEQIAGALEEERGVSEELRQKLVDMADEMTKQQYEWDKMQETVEKIGESIDEEKKAETTVNVNVNPEISVNPAIDASSEVVVNPTISADSTNSNSAEGGDASATTEEGEKKEEIPEDSILTNTNAEALDGAVETATVQEAVEVPAVPTENPEQSAPFEITTSDEGAFGAEGNPEAAPIENETPAIVETEVPQEPVEAVVPEPAQETPAFVETEPAYVPETDPAVMSLPEETAASETEIPTEAPAEIQTEIQTEVPTEAPTEIETERKVLLWNETDADRIAAELSEFTSEYPTQDGFEKDQMIPLPAQGRWLMVKDGEAADEVAFEDDGTGFLIGVPLADADKLNPKKDADVDGLYEASFPNGETMKYVLFITSDGKYVFVPADETGAVPTDSEQLYEKVKEFYAEFAPAEEAPQETEAVPADAEAEYAEPNESPEDSGEVSEG